MAAAICHVQMRKVLSTLQLLLPVATSIYSLLRQSY